MAGTTRPTKCRDGTKIRICARAAEATGLDSVWVYDHLMYQLGKPWPIGHHEAWTLLTALAGVTDRIQLGTLVMAVPFRSPTLLAKMAATFEEISGGRLILGLGCGWHQPEFRAFGYQFDHRVERFEEAIRIISELIRRGVCSYSGKWYAADSAEILPPIARPDGKTTPLLIAARGPRMLRAMAMYADACNVAWVGSPDQLPPRMRKVEMALLEVGRDPATLDLTVGVHVVLPQLSTHPISVRNDAIGGSAQQLAESRNQFRELGVDHLIVALTPTSPSAIIFLGEAVVKAGLAVDTAQSTDVAT